MNEYITVSEKTIEDALTEAKIILGAATDEIEYEVVEKGSSGFLGMGAKNAVIKVRKKDALTNDKADIRDDKQEEAKKERKQTVSSTNTDNNNTFDESKTAPVKTENNNRKGEINSDEATQLACDFLSNLFTNLSMNVSIQSSYVAEDGAIQIELSGDEMGLLIGKRGQTLDSIQYLTSLIVNKDKDYYVHIKIDTENYRERRKATLENLARNISSKVKRTNRAVTLEPMNPYERRIIHYALQSDKSVNTHSEGEEPYRKIIVTPNRRR